MLAAYDADPFRCWYALADWLDERDEPRAAARLRWWHGTARPALVADDVPRTAPAPAPVTAGLFALTAEGPRLLGSRCASCATPTRDCCRWSAARRI